MYSRLTYILLAVAALGSTACTSETDGADSPANGFEVSFRASTESRAAIANSSTIKNTPFAVYGEFVATDNPAATPVRVFNATEVSYTDGAWKYANVQYWFPAMTYSFIALHPAADPDGLSNKEYTDNQLSFTYTLPADYRSATDILAATHRRRYDSGATSPVAFNMGHILSRINFAVNVDQTLSGAGNAVVIERLALRNVSNSATFSLSPAPLTSAPATDDYVGGWTAHAEVTDLTPALFDITFAEPITLTAGSRHEFFPLSGTDALVAIPQLLTPDITVEITYHRVHNGIAQTVQTATGNLYSVAVASHGGSWSPGQSYTYSFALGGEEYIIFNPPVVQDWNEAEGASYIITD